MTGAALGGATGRGGAPGGAITAGALMGCDSLAEA
jgi:hypothetical protein